MATKEVSNFTDEELSRHIQECLHRIKRDEAFMEGELASSDYDAIKKGVDKEILHKFLQYVAKCMQLKKKAFGKLEEKLYEGPLLQQEIAKLDAGVEDGETKTKKSKKKSIKVKKEKEEDVISEQEEIDDDPVLEPKKRNRSNNGSATKEGKKKGRMQISFSEAERKRYSQEARKEYNAQKADVLSRLPQSYKKHWGQIMFGRWKKDPWRPVLIVGPYEMAPAFRETWMKMFENTKGDPQRMWQWCYWYGSPDSEAFTQQKVNTFLSYEKAEDQNIHKLPAFLQAKVDAGKKLKGAEEQTVKGYACLEKELKKKPELRIPIKFVEDFDAILELDDDVSLPADGDIDDGFDSASQGETMMSDSDTVVSKEKKVKKTNTDPIIKNTGKIIDKKISIKQVPSEKKAIVRKKKKKSIVTNGNADVMDTATAADASPASSPISSTPTSIAKKKALPQSQEKEENVGETELSDGGIQFITPLEKSKGRVKDFDNAQKKATVNSIERKRRKVSSATKDENKLKKSKIKLEGENEQNDANVKEVSNVLPIEYLAEGTTPEIEENVVIKKIDYDIHDLQVKEAISFMTCVDRYKQIVKELEASIASKDEDKITDILSKLLDGVMDFSVPFIEDYGLAKIVKDAKTILVDKDHKKLRKDLWEKMKSVYEEKKNSVPEGWRLKLTGSYVSEEISEKKIKQEKKGPLDRVNDSEDSVGVEDRIPVLSSGREPSFGDVTDEKNVVNTTTSLKSDTDSVAMSRQKLTSTKPVELIKSEEAVSSKIDQSPIVSVTSKPTIKKKNSLVSWKSLMNMDKPKEATTDTPKATRVHIAPDSVAMTKKVPQWLTYPAKSIQGALSCEDREFGIEFLEEAVKVFPETVNRSGFARVLEGAIFTWATQQQIDQKSDWKLLYWEKIHTLSGAFGGKHSVGTIVDDIMHAIIDSAESLINLPDNALFLSFEGKAANGHL